MFSAVIIIEFLILLLVSFPGFNSFDKRIKYLVNFRDVFMEKHWKSVIHKSICDYFFEVQSKVGLTGIYSHTRTIDDFKIPILIIIHVYIISE